MPDGRTIAVIGGGASAAIFLAHLIHQNINAPLEIIIFDRKENFARGIAYSTEKPEHLLNVRAEAISAIAGKPDHFYEWLVQNKHPYKKTDFVPRIIYGKYLTDLFEKFLDHAARKEWAITLKHENVTGIEGQKVIAGDNSYHADTIILATGNCMPFTPEGAEKFTISDGYHREPWSIDYRKISKSDEIVILGTGLSMVDTVLSLHKANYKGKITAISRNGLLPATHVDPCTWPDFIKELPPSVLSLSKTIHSQVKLAKKQNIPWQAVIDSLRAKTNEIYLSWNKKEQNKAHRLSSFWKIHRHRMPPEAAAIIDECKKNNLSIVKNRISNVSKEGGKLIVTGKSKTFTANHVINCLGYGAKPGLSPLPHEKFLPENWDKTNFYAIGPALSGYYFETTAIPEIRAQAAIIADKIGKNGAV